MALEESTERKLARIVDELDLQPTSSAGKTIEIPAQSCLVDFRRFEFAQPSAEKPCRFTSRPHYLAQVYQADHSVRMIDLGSADKIEQAISRWREPVEQANRDGSLISAAQQQAMDQAGRELRQLIWDPISLHLEEADLVIISPDSALGRFPFIALPGQRQGSYLLEELKIVNFPVPVLLPGLLERPVKPTKQTSKALLVGEIEYGGDGNQDGSRSLRFRNQRILKKLQFDSLPGSAAEVLQIEKLFEDSLTLSKNLATEQAFQTHLKDYQILHIATHGFFQSPDQFVLRTLSEDRRSFVVAQDKAKILSENPDMLSGLAFANANQAASKSIDAGANDGILYSAEIAMLPMEHVELAVLSACETSLGTDDSPGEGLIGIQRAFQVAGAKSTIASYWKVDDRATQLLMNKFYENLLEYSKNADPEELKNNRTTIRIDALRDAQLWMLNNPIVASTTSRGEPVEVDPAKIKKAETELKPSDKNQRTHPRYWAAFMLSGDWR